MGHKTGWFCRDPTCEAFGRDIFYWYYITDLTDRAADGIQIRSRARIVLAVDDEVLDISMCGDVWELSSKNKEERCTTKDKARDGEHRDHQLEDDEEIPSSSPLMQR